MLICTVSTVRASQADLELFTNYHLNSGIDHMYLFFDDPDDPCIKFFAQDNRIACIPCNADHWRARHIGENASIEQRQVANANHALNLARDAGIDWLIHLDGDELLFAGKSNFKTYLANPACSDLDAITFPTLEAVPRPRYSRHAFLEITQFKRHRRGMKVRRALARLLGCRQPFQYGYFKGHTFGKTVVRVSANPAVIDIHLPLAREGQNLRMHRSTDAFLLHFDCCTIDDWITKWKRRLEGTAIATQMRDDRKQQFAEFTAAYQSGSRENMLRTYHRRHLVSRFQRTILQTLGLLQDVRIPAERFSKSVCLKEK